MVIKAILSRSISPLNWWLDDESFLIVVWLNNKLFISDGIIRFVIDDDDDADDVDEGGGGGNGCMVAVDEYNCLGFW